MASNESDVTSGGTTNAGGPTPLTGSGTVVLLRPRSCMVDDALVRGSTKNSFSDAPEFVTWIVAVAGTRPATPRREERCLP